MSVFYSVSCYALCETKGVLSNVYNFNTVTVQRDAPVGSIINEISWKSGPSGFVLFECSGSGSTHYLMPSLTQTSIDHVYATNVPGVGLMIQDSGKLYFENPQTTISWGK